MSTSQKQQIQIDPASSVSAVGEGERSEPESSADTKLASGDLRRPDPEVSALAKRRRFTASYKLEILRRAELCTRPGELGALLRSEGLYSSHLGKWRKLAQRGALDELADKTRGPKSTKHDPVAIENARLRREVTHLQERLSQAEAIIDIQKKLSLLLGLASPGKGDIS